MEETAALIERSQAGDKEARERLIEENLGLVRHIVSVFWKGDMTRKICFRSAVSV